MRRTNAGRPRPLAGRPLWFSGNVDRYPTLEHRTYIRERRANPQARKGRSTGRVSRRRNPSRPDCSRLRVRVPALLLGKSRVQDLEDFSDRERLSQDALPFELRHLPPRCRDEDEGGRRNPAVRVHRGEPARGCPRSKAHHRGRRRFCATELRLSPRRPSALAPHPNLFRTRPARRLSIS